MSLPFVNELNAVEGGHVIARVLEAMQDQLQASPIRIGQTHIYSGRGTPVGNQVGYVGDLYLRTDGSTTTTLYVKETGNNTKTGWVAK